MSNYVRLCRTLKDYGKLIPENDDISKYVDNQDLDYYLSLYKYNQSQYEKFKSSGSISGINDVVTDRIVFDFDVKDITQTLEDAKRDARQLYDKLVNEGIPSDNINIYYSGSKGFHVEFRSDKTFNQTEYRNLVHTIASGLPTFDDKIWNASRVLRLPNTKHQETGLYKIALEYADLKERTIEQIKERAKKKEKINTNFLLKVTKLPDSIYLKKNNNAQPKLDLIVRDGVSMAAEIKYKEFNPVGKPKWMSNCLYAISQGFFNKGERHDAIHRMAVLYQQQGFPKNVVFKMIQGMSDLQSMRMGEPRREDAQLESEVSSVFDDRWRGGTYSCKTDFWLKKYCGRLGNHACKHEVDGVELLSVDEVSERFEHFAKNIDKYIIKTGIESLDKRLRLMVGNVLGVLAAPSAGKSSLMMTFLNNMSKSGTDSLVFSMDMYEKLLFQRLAQKHMSYQMDELYDIYKKEDIGMQDKIKKIITEEYANVGFCFQSGLTIEEIEHAIIKRENEIGRKVRVIAVDYLELVNGEASDPTQSSLNVAAGLKNLSTKLEILVILILQPQKNSSRPDEPIKSFNSAKGSGMIGQSVSYFIGCHREGLNPDYPGADKFFTIRCLKNRTGELFSLDYSWTGLTGSIKELNDIEKVELQQLREQKKEDEKNKGKNDGWD